MRRGLTEMMDFCKIIAGEQSIAINTPPLLVLTTHPVPLSHTLSSHIEMMDFCKIIAGRQSITNNPQPSAHILSPHPTLPTIHLFVTSLHR